MRSEHRERLLRRGLVAMTSHKITLSLLAIKV
jgi:hypothetical protein